MKILLVANFIPDRQRSMQRFARMLRDGLRARGHEVRVVRPRLWLSRKLKRKSFAGSETSLENFQRKWLAYIDKFILFPRTLRCAAQWADIVHICDHSNAMYVGHVAGKPH